ncbi:MAG: MBL fold metallo-hydrolase [Candidatus Aminicenantes bacterium]|nr:MBL fold metallo-hydrolase [Candidatus Aminicenantes bacterium]
MIFKKLAFPPFSITAFCQGFMHLDGGAMFGVVPKVLWEKLSPSDSSNRIKMALNSLVIENGKDVILVETGIGTTLKQKYLDMYGVEDKPDLFFALNELGILPEDITIVVNTHLHFDHCGGNTVMDHSGKVVPAFPKARYFIQKGEWEHAIQPNERDKASYLEENYLPLQSAGCLELIEGNVCISEGVETLLTPGHTAHHQCVRIFYEKKSLLFLGDLVPMSTHIGLPYIMSYDLYPIKTLETKKKIYAKVLEEDMIVAFVHDPVHLFGRLEKKNNKFRFIPCYD